MALEFCPEGRDEFNPDALECLECGEIPENAELVKSCREFYEATHIDFYIEGEEVKEEEEVKDTVDFIEERERREDESS